MKNYFTLLQDKIAHLLQNDEIFTCTYEGENSDFCRFNHSKIRQGGQVSQHYIKVQLIQGSRHASFGLDLCQRIEEDIAAIAGEFAKTRSIIKLLPEDPHLFINDKVSSTEYIGERLLSSREEIVTDVLDLAGDLDFVGILAMGAKAPMSWRSFLTCRF